MKLAIFSLLSVVSATAVFSGSAQAYSTADTTPAPRIQGLPAIADSYEVDGEYEVKKNLTLRPGQVRFEDAFVNYDRPVILEQGDSQQGAGGDIITILGKFTNASGELIYRVGLSTEDEPPVIDVPAAILAGAELVKNDETETVLDERVAGSDELAIDQLMEARAYGHGSYRGRRHGHHGGRHMTYCVAKVNGIARARGICHAAGLGAEAATALPTVLHVCPNLHEVSYGEGLPVGTICTVQGGYHWCGRGRGRPHMCGDMVIKVSPTAWSNGYSLRDSPTKGNYWAPRCAAP